MKTSNDAMTTGGTEQKNGPGGVESQLQGGVALCADYDVDVGETGVAAVTARRAGDDRFGGCFQVADEAVDPEYRSAGERRVHR